MRDNTRKLAIDPFLHLKNTMDDDEEVGMGIGDLIPVRTVYVVSLSCTRLRLFTVSHPDFSLRYLLCYGPNLCHEGTRETAIS